MGRPMKVAAVTLSILGTTVLGSVTAMAAETQTSFMAHYQHNAQTEAGLLQKAQASTVTNSDTVALSNTVNSLNQQILTLYGAEQALASSRATVPTATQNNKTLSNLTQQRSKLVAELNVEQANIRKYQKNDQTKLLKSAQQQRNITIKKIQLIDLQIASIKNGPNSWKQHPFDGALTDLQSAIYHLQASAIHYTTMWVNETKSVPTPVVTSVSGLTYASTAVAIPQTGTASFSDVVAVQPTVKDQNGNIVPTSGVFTLSGPTGASGVTIDSTTGTITVQPGATRGNYAVTFAQGPAQETVTLTLS